MKSEEVRLLLKTRSLFSTTQELLPFFVFCSVFCLQFVLSKSTASRLTKHSAVTHPITEFAPGWCHGYLQGYGWATLQWLHLGHTHTAALCIAVLAVGGEGRAVNTEQYTSVVSRESERPTSSATRHDYRHTSHTTTTRQGKASECVTNLCKMRRHHSMVE